jgi:hypothetical protein
MEEAVSGGWRSSYAASMTGLVGFADWKRARGKGTRMRSVGMKGAIIARGG